MLQIGLIQLAKCTNTDECIVLPPVSLMATSEKHSHRTD